eukprot:7116142-Prymnesium_polylepis.1
MGPRRQYSAPRAQHRGERRPAVGRPAEQRQHGPALPGAAADARPVGPVAAAVAAGRAEHCDARDAAQERPHPGRAMNLEVHARGGAT